METMLVYCKDKSSYPSIVVERVKSRGILLLLSVYKIPPLYSPLCSFLVMCWSMVIWSCPSVADNWYWSCVIVAAFYNKWNPDIFPIQSLGGFCCLKADFSGFPSSFFSLVYFQRLPSNLSQWSTLVSGKWWQRVANSKVTWQLATLTDCQYQTLIFNEQIHKSNEIIFNSSYNKQQN